MEDPDLIISKNEIEMMPKLIRKAITQYTQTVEINRLLRKGVLQKSESKRPGDFQQMLRRMDMAFSLVTPTTHDIIVYRGIKGKGIYPDDLGYVSTSYRRLNPNQISLFTGSGCCMLLIRIPAGSSVLRIPATVGIFGDENEVLLFRGGQFELATSPFGINIDFGIRTFELDYIQAKLPDQNPTLMTEMRKYMETNELLFEYLNSRDFLKFQDFLSKQNFKMVFRCLLGNTTHHIGTVATFMDAIFHRYKVPNMEIIVDDDFEALLNTMVEMKMFKMAAFFMKNAAIDPYVQLVKMLRNGDFDFESIHFFVENGALKSDRDTMAFTYILKHKNYNLVKYFIDNNVILPSFGVVTLLHNAIATDNLDILRIVLDYIETKLTPVMFKQSISGALSIAVSANKLDVVEILLKRGAVDEGNRALKNALGRNDLVFAQLLVDNGSDVKAVSSLLGIAKLATIKFMIDHGAIVTSDLFLENLQIIYQDQMESGTVHIPHKEIVQIAEIFLQNGADANVKNGSAIYLAIKLNDFELLKLLIRYGADVNTKTALPTAASLGRFDLVKYLIEQGATKYKDFAMIDAVRGNHLDIVKFLVDDGVDLKMYGRLALIEATNRHNDEIKEFLISRGAKLN